MSALYYISQIVINFHFDLNFNTVHLDNMETSFNFKCVMILVFYLCILVLSKYIGGKIIKSQNYFYQNLFTIKLFFSELLGRNCFCNIITSNNNYFTNYRAEMLYIYSAIFVCNYVKPSCIIRYSTAYRPTHGRFVVSIFPSQKLIFRR